MAEKPLFSVIIPTFNCAHYLKRALHSVDQQTCRDFEVIVCDDGSEDNTKETVNGFRERFLINYIRDAHWGGPARPRNNGIKATQGQFIAFLDSDDWWHADKLETVKENLDDYDFVYHDCDLHSKRGKLFYKKFGSRKFKKPVFIDMMKNESILANSSMVVKTDIIKKVGGFTEELSSTRLTCFEDVDLWLKVARITNKFLYIPRCLGAYWSNDRNVSEPSETLMHMMNLVYARHLEFLNEHDRKQSIMTMHYLLGRTKQKMGLPEKALESFKISVKSGNWKFKFRSALWIVLLGLTKQLGTKR